MIYRNYVPPVRPDEIYHYGIKRRSGRYPWGSGDRPYQSEKKSGIGSENKIKYKSPTAQIAKNFAISYAATLARSTLNVLVPGSNLITLPASAAYLTNYLLKYKFDKTNYIKKEGEVEKISDLKRKKDSSVMVDLDVVNPGRKGTKGRVNNCLNCTAAMEMRARGYDVIARSRGSGANFDIWTKIFEGAKIENPRVEKIKGESRKQYVNRVFDNYCNQIEKFGDGARGSAMFAYANMRGSGHSIFWKVEKGTVVFYDAQNKTVNATDLFALSDPNSYTFVRFDNLPLIENNICTMVVSSKKEG